MIGCCANRHRNSWGQSADALSVALQMLTNGGNTEGLFHGAFMESGGVHPSGDITLGQQDYDGLVRAAGCAGAEDTLECLRQAPFATLKAALDTSPVDLSYWVRHSFNPLSPVTNYIPQSLNLVWPRGQMEHSSKPRCNS